MEYLMTYGWAILIIAVVLGALYSLGVFNMSAYMPKIGPGACHVFRPNGPSTSWNVALTGSCAGYLPQYVAQFVRAQYSYVQITEQTSLSFSASQSFSVSAWVKPSSIDGVYEGIVTRVSSSSYNYDLQAMPSNQFTFEIYDGSLAPTVGNFIYGANVWYFLAGVYDGSAHQMYLYVNGALNSQSSIGSLGTITNTGPTMIGTFAYFPTGYNFNGQIANAQIYNTSLTANQVQYLYNEGIGGAPIYLQHLVGWWPLNGDTKDYSGNNNNGVPTNVIYSGSWTSGYYH